MLTFSRARGVSWRIWGYTYNDKVANPVQAHSKCNTLGPQRRREYFSGHGPANGAPAGAIGNHEHKHEGNADPRLGLVRSPVTGELAAQRGRDDVAGEHAHGADEEQLAPADHVHGPYAGQDADELHYVEDAGHDELHVVVEAHFPVQGTSVSRWPKKRLSLGCWCETYSNSVGE